MTVASPKLTFEEFLAYDDGTDTLYELENGVLVAVPAESELNRRIVMLLVATLLKLGVAYEQLSLKTELAVSSTRVSVRVPDLVMLSEDGVLALEGASRSLVGLDAPPPLLVVEVVSPGRETRDYRYKRSEYAARGIQEYWIVDPLQSRVAVLAWVEGLYEETIYTGATPTSSAIISGFTLTAHQVLRGSLAG